MSEDYYSRIAARIWIDTKGWGERNQLVTIYLLTNRHSTMEGLYHLPLGYLCADLSLTPRQATAALSFIEGKGVVSYDRDAEVVFVRKALKHGAPKTPNHITGAMNRLRSVPPSPLWDAFFMACECHASGLADAMRTAWPDSFALSTSSSNSSSNPVVSPVVSGRASAGERTQPTDLALEVTGILQRGIDGLTTDERCKQPTPSAVAAVIGDASEIQVKAAAIEARSIAQSQNRAPNIVALFAQRLQASNTEAAA